MPASATLPSTTSVWGQDLDDADHYEIVDGTKVELPPMSADATQIANDLTFAINTFSLSQNLGKAYTEMLFRLPLPLDRNRRPDVGYVPFSRWAKDRPLPAVNGWEALPDLVVEVISPFDYLENAREKLAEYFRAGVRLVWQVLPKLQLVDVYESPTRVAILTREQDLDGGVVIPGFRLPLRELFIGAP
jgi:Uma2 family endonuclease